MAKEEKDELEEEDKETQEGTPERKKVPINLIIISILVLCLLGGGIYVWKSGIMSGDPDEAALDEEGGKQEMGPIYSLDTFIVNLVGGRGKNYLKAKVELELDSEKTTIEIEKRLPQVRDAILTMLSSKSNEDINTLEGKFQLRAEIISTLNQNLTAGKVRNVYFTDFIVQ
ncbi:MAG: flagellar basal body-associated FliL family protein [Desulfobacteraceae bacterium]|jgi:flagellar FliL protein